MKTLLAIEWLKIKRHRTFWVMAALFLALLPLWNLGISGGIISLGNKGVNLFSQDYTFPGAWHSYGYWGSVFVLFLSILVITITCNEFTFRTQRQNVIDGWSRMDFFHGKVALIVAFSFIAALYLFVAGGMHGGLYSGTFAGIFSEIKLVAYFFLLSLNYMGFALILALLIKRSGLTISLFLLYAILVETFAVFTINYLAGERYGNLLPLQASDTLLPFPWPPMIKRAIDGQAHFPDGIYVGASLFWCAVYYVSGRALISKRDL